ncbi:MAG: RNA polymerase sigma factor [Ilumatobacteraceae bacterium]
MELTSEAPVPASKGEQLRCGDADELDDAMLVVELRRGSEMAFTNLVHRYEASMLRVARAYVSNQASAEDVVQETWIAVLRGIDGFDARSSLKTWLYRILTNRAKSAGTSEGRCVPDSALIEREIDDCSPVVSGDRFLSADHPRLPRHWRRPPLEWERTLEDGVVQQEAIRIVNDAIKELTLLQRLVIIYRDVEFWTPEEVCDLLCITSANQRVLLHRARTTVRERLESQYGIVQA